MTFLFIWIITLGYIPKSGITNSKGMNAFIVSVTNCQLAPQKNRDKLQISQYYVCDFSMQKLI